MQKEIPFPYFRKPAFFMEHMRLSRDKAIHFGLPLSTYQKRISTGITAISGNINFCIPALKVSSFQNSKSSNNNLLIHHYPLRPSQAELEEKPGRVGSIR